MERLIKKKGSVESLQQLIAYSKNQTGIASSLSAKNQKNSQEMLSQSGSNTKLQQQATSSHNQVINFNNNQHSNHVNLIQYQQQNQQFPFNNFNEDDENQLLNKNTIPQNNFFSSQVMAASCVNNNKNKVKNHPMQQASQSSTQIGQSQVVGRKKSQGLLQNINNQNLNMMNGNNMNNNQENNNLLHNSKHNDKHLLMDVLSSNQQHHQQLLQRTSQKNQHNQNNESNQQSPLECTSGSKNRNESSGHDGPKVQNAKLNNLINQLTKQSQFNSQFQDGGSPSKIFEDVSASNNKQKKKSKQQLQQIGVNSNEKQKNTMHSYSNSLTNQKNKSSNCSSQQHLLQVQQYQPNNTIPLQNPTVMVMQNLESPEIQHKKLQQMYGQEITNYQNIGALSQSSSVAANLGYNQQQMGYLQNHLQPQQPYITDQIHKILCGKSQVASTSSSLQQHISPQVIQQNQQFQQHNMKQNDYYEINPKIDKSNLKLTRNGCQTQQNQANSPQSQANATTTTQLQNSNQISSTNFPLQNGNQTSNTSSTITNHLIYNNPQSNISGKQNSSNTSQNVKKGEKNKTKKQLTINTAEVHQTYNFPSNHQIPHTTNTTSNKNQQYGSNDENKIQNQQHNIKQNIQGLYNQYLQQSQVSADPFSIKNNVNVQSQQLYLQSAQIQQLLSQQQLLSSQQLSHQQSISQQSNLHQSSNLSSCNRPKTAKNSASSSSNKQNFNLNSSKSKQQQNVVSPSSSSIMKQLSPKYQQQLAKYEGMNHILQYQPDLIMKENILNQIGKQSEINNFHEVNQQEPFFLSPKHPKSQPQSTKSQTKQAHFEFPIQLQQQNQQQVINQAYQNEQINLSQTMNQQKQQSKKNLQINNLMLQQQYNQSSTLPGQSQNSQMLTNKKFSSSRETQDLKSNSNLKQSSTRDTSIQKLQRTDLIKIVQRTSQILNSYSKQREFWKQEKKMLLNEVNQLRTRLQFYEDNTNLQ